MGGVSVEDDGELVLAPELGNDLEKALADEFYGFAAHGAGAVDDGDEIERLGLEGGSVDAGGEPQLDEGFGGRLVGRGETGGLGDDVDEVAGLGFAIEGQVVLAEETFRSKSGGGRNVAFCDEVAHEVDVLGAADGGA